MVKGISRRVIVVDSPDPRVFDQAIFILRNDVLEGDGVSSRQLVDQAVRIAKSYTRCQGLPPPKRHRLTPAIAAMLGGGLMGLVSRGAFVMLTCAFLPFFLLTYGRPYRSPGFFAFRRGNFVLYWGKLR